MATFEPDVEPNADRSDDAEDDEISPLRLQFGHILEIHAVDSGNRGRHREDRSPGGKLTGDRTLALLFEQVTRLEHRDQDVADAGDGALNPWPTYPHRNQLNVKPVSLFSATIHPGVHKIITAGTDDKYYYRRDR